MTSDQTSVSRETSPRMEAFLSLLVTWNRRINLISQSDLDHLDQRHLADSQQVYDCIPEVTTSWLDLGSGAGFPGLVCAIEDKDRNGSVRFTLVESDTRKSAFLREAARITQTRVDIVPRRIEDIVLTSFDVISARALAPLPQLLSYATPFAHSETTFLFSKGQNAETELTLAAADWHVTAERIQSRTDPSGTILKLTEVSARS